MLNFAVLLWVSAIFAAGYLLGRVDAVMVAKTRRLKAYNARLRALLESGDEFTQADLDAIADENIRGLG